MTIGVLLRLLKKYYGPKKNIIDFTVEVLNASLSHDLINSGNNGEYFLDRQSFITESTIEKIYSRGLSSTTASMIIGGMERKKLFDYLYSLDNADSVANLKSEFNVDSKMSDIKFFDFICEQFYTEVNCIANADNSPILWSARPISLCIGTFVTVMSLCSLDKTRETELLGYMLACVLGGGDNPLPPENIKRLCECEENLPKAFAKWSRNVDSADVARAFFYKVLSSVDQNKRKTLVLALLQMIKYDSEIDNDTILLRAYRCTKLQLLSMHDFIFSDLISGLFLYVLGYTSNTSGQSTLELVDDGFIKSLAKMKTPIKILERDYGSERPLRYETKATTPDPDLSELFREIFFEPKAGLATSSHDPITKPLLAADDSSITVSLFQENTVYSIKTAFMFPEPSKEDSREQEPKEKIRLNEHYELISTIGSGGSGRIYRAYDKRLGKTVVLKRISEFSGDTEVNILKDLKHPKIPQVFGIISGDGYDWLVMEYIEGDTLSKEVMMKGVLSQQRLIKYSLQLCEVVKYLHSQTPAVIHCDIKPSNIMITPEDTVYLIDYNLSQKLDSITPISIRGYTAGYSAYKTYNKAAFLLPAKETAIFLNRTISPMFDIYSIGATMFFLATGKHPPIHHDRIIEELKNNNINKGISQIIIKCTRPTPSMRYESVSELMSGIKEIKTTLN